MKVQKGDKIRLVRPTSKFKSVGEIFTVTNTVVHGIVITSDTSGEKAIFSDAELRHYFEKVDVKESVRKVSEEKIDKMLSESKKVFSKTLDKTTVVAVRLPNGFEMVESSSCVDPKAYSDEIGKEICLQRIRERLFEMESYHIQAMEYETMEIVDKMSKTNTGCPVPYQEITEAITKSAFDEMITEIKKVGAKDFTPYTFGEKLKEISQKYNVDMDELADAMAEKAAENIFNNVLQTMFRP